ncbi:MAG: cell division protein FtsQ/DivIB [Actinomycetota bacterium]
MSDSAARTRTDPRISRRRRAVARNKRRRAIVRALAVCGLALALWLAFFSPLLAISEVKLAGAQHTSADEVARVVGLDASDNLLLLSTTDVAARVRTLPWVKSATVERKLPGTVKVTVTERTPVLVLAMGDERYLLDGRARVLAVGASDEDLPVLAGPQLFSPQPGERLTAVPLQSALRAFSSMPRRLRAEVVAVFAPTVERITFQLTDGIQVRYGAAEGTASKNEVLKVLLERLRAEGRPASYVDVRVPQAPAVSPLPSAPQSQDDDADTSS